MPKNKQKRAKYECSCEENFRQAKDCPFSGHCIEPLAWNLSPKTSVAQDKCPLFTTLPKEIRDLIWEYALTNCRSNFPEQACNTLLWPNTWTRQQPLKTPKFTGPLGPSDIAVNLLLTCQRVYLETYTLPLTINTFSFTDLNLHVQRTRFLPWQLALIQRLRLTLQQLALEGFLLRHYLETWCAIPRQKGTYIVPFKQPVHYQNHRGGRTVPNCIESFNYALVAGPTITTDNAADAPQLPTVLEMNQIPSAGHCCVPPPSKMRVMLTRPLTHLTIRLEPEHWWTWTDDFTSTDPTHQLALDPWLGNGESGHHDRPTADKMRQMADHRRAREHSPIDFPAQDPPWGHTIAQLPGLKTLELVLETFVEKQHQLEAVVECAKTWRFPIDGLAYALVWDGNVESGKRMHERAGPVSASVWSARRLNFYQVRTVRFMRRRI